MLNTLLTVRAHQAFSHKGIGWEEFTDAAIRALNEQERPIVFLLWGKPAQQKATMLNNPKHLILTAPHPSPLSWILWMQAFQPGKCISGIPRYRAN